MRSVFFFKKTLLVTEKRPDMNPLQEIREIRREITCAV